MLDTTVRMTKSTSSPLYLLRNCSSDQWLVLHANSPSVITVH